MMNEINKLKRKVLELNIILTLTLLLLVVFSIKFIDRDTKLTVKVLEISQKVDVDFSTKTNNLIWTSIQPN